ncbi:MAG TPA: NUDIX domain-containing protein [Candidatus Dormibacteraeota bacterium]|nr:NUDIX domain-containing protein [Candidatus Dormibacteraeota bacterium]
MSDDGSEAIDRPAARVLLLDPAGRVLLLRFVDPVTGFAWWATPGGGIGPGETAEEAASREVLEETGLRDLALGPCIWLRETRFEWRGRRYRQTEQIFAAAVPPFEPSREGFLPEEVEMVREHRWWTADEIERSDDRFGPRRLGRLLKDLLRDGFPPEPLQLDS